MWGIKFLSGHEGQCLIGETSWFITLLTEPSAWKALGQHMRSWDQPISWQISPPRGNALMLRAVAQVWTELHTHWFQVRPWHRYSLFHIYRDFINGNSTLNKIFWYYLRVAKEKLAASQTHPVSRYYIFLLFYSWSEIILFYEWVAVKTLPHDMKTGTGNF